MKILIHHNAVPSTEHGNFGDLAMLQAALDCLSLGIEGAELHVLECPRIWQERDNVQTVRYSLPVPGTRLWQLAMRRPFRWARRTIPALDALTHRMRRTAPIIRHAILGRGARVARFPMIVEQGAMTLEDWCQSYDALFIAGGGALNDIFPAPFWTSSCLIHGFFLQGKPVILTGQQLGPFHYAATRKSLLRTLRKVSFIGLREATESLRLCEEAGMEQSRATVMGDDSFGVAPAPPSEVQALLAGLGLSPGRFIAVNIRLSFYTPAAAKYLPLLAKFLSNLSQDYQMPLLVVPIAIGEKDSDITAGHRLAEVLSDDQLQVLEKQPLSSALLKGVLGSAYAALGMSYHFCTFALSQGVPTVALFAGDYYAQKAYGISQFWNDERLAAPFAALETAAGIERIRSVLDDEHLREVLRGRAEEATRRWQMMFKDRVIQLLQRQNRKQEQDHLVSPVLTRS
jgi:polysaccharide pyruvyl transferase WcaK-like protein